MKLALVATKGGHLAQIRKIFDKDVLGDDEHINIIETDRILDEGKDKKTYLFRLIGYNPFGYFPAILKCMKIFRKEKIKLVITTGSTIGPAAMVAGKLLGIKTVFIDTVIRVKRPTLAGKFSYPFSDIFLVQNKGMERRYGKRAKYVGGII